MIMNVRLVDIVGEKLIKFNDMKRAFDENERKVRRKL